MTNEMQWFIDFEDLIAIEFQCQACHARVVSKLADKPKILGKCPNCFAEFYGPKDKTRWERVGELCKFLADAPSLTEGTNLKLRLQLSPPNKQKGQNDHEE